MVDADLAAALKMAKGKKMFFAFVPKGAEGTLIVSKVRIPTKAIADAKKEIGGSNALTGKVFGPLTNLVFQVAKPAPSTLGPAIKKTVHRDAALNIVPEVQVASDADADEEKVVAAEPAPKPTKPVLPVPKVHVIPGGEKGTLMDLAKSLDSATPIQGAFSDGVHYFITINGKQVEINQQELVTNRTNAKAAFAKAAKQVRQRASDAQDEYRIYRDTMTEGVIDGAITWIFDHVAVTDPGSEVKDWANAAKAIADQAEAAANGNVFTVAATHLTIADTFAHKAHALVKAYRDGIESAAETTVSGLEAVKTAAEVTLVVGGAVVTGGATVAAVGGAAITAADDLAPGLYGHKVDWSKFAFDMALAYVMHKAAPAQQMEKALMEKLGPQALQKVGEKALQQAIIKTVSTSSEIALKKGMETAQKALSGKDVTWEQFNQEVQKEFTKELAKLVLEGLLKK